MTDIMAAIGLKQLDRYPGLLARRGEIIARYDAMCDEMGVSHLTISRTAVTIIILLITCAVYTWGFFKDIKKYLKEKK